MKAKITTVIVLLVLPKILFSQPQFIEQMSGVTTALNYIYPTGWSGTGAVSYWICGDSGVVLKSIYYTGGTWVNVSGNGLPSNINLNTIASVRINSTIALTSGVRSDTAIVYRTSNAGLNWTEVFRQRQSSFNAIIFTDTSGMMIGNPVGGRWAIWKTTNAGLTFDSAGMYLPQNGNEIGFRNSFNLCQYAPGYLFFGTSNSRVYYSSNRGISWQYMTLPVQTAIYSMHFTACYSPAIITGYVGCSSKVLFTTNSGTIWSDAGNIPGIGNITGLYACPMPVTYFGQNEILITREDGNIYTIPYPGGNNWLIRYTAPSGNYRYLTNSMSSFQLFAVRDNGGISWGSCGTYRVDRISDIIPIDFSLSQNFPNPFNPTTRIEFDIPVSSLVKILIFDVTGREITRIVEQNLDPGEYRAEWDASSFSSGVYFYSLLAGDFSQTRKMILVK